MKVNQKFLKYQKQLTENNYSTKVLTDSKLFYKYIGSCRIDITIRNDGKILKKRVYLIDFEVETQNDIEILQFAFDTLQGDISSLSC